MCAEASKSHEISVFLATWNLGNNAPPDVLGFIPKGQYDIYAIGVQESLYMDEGRGELKIEFHWTGLLEQAIGPGYQVICSQTLSPRTDTTYKSVTVFKDAVSKGLAKSSGVRLTVFVKEKLASSISSVEVLFQACGRLGGASGNKGGVAVVINLSGTRIAFITSHLNAHMENMDKRNEDFDMICRGLHPIQDVFGDKSKSEEANPSPDHVEVLNRCDLVLWFGDLNYRIQPLPDLNKQPEMHQMILEMIRKSDVAKMIEHDQLRLVQRQRIAFFGFEEMPITFAPTFKLNPNCDASMDPKDRYSTDRVPAYCDRIVWRALPHVSVKCENYKSHPDVLTSDHTPISANMTLKMPVVPSGKGKPTKFQVTLSNIILQTEGSLSPALDPKMKARIFLIHKLASNRASLDPMTGLKRVWEEPLVLQSQSPLNEIRRQPLLVVVLADPGDAPVGSRLLGEGMISLHDLTIPFVKVNLLQGGKPFGILVADIKFEEEK